MNTKQYNKQYYHENKSRIKERAIARPQRQTKQCCTCKKVKSVRAFLRVWADAEVRRSQCNDCRNKKRRVLYKENPEPLKKVSRDRGRALRQEILDVYGGKCACPGCDVTEPKFLAIDHIDGSGYAHRFLEGHGRKLYLWLKRRGFPKDNFQLLCHNCNFAKGAYGKCPHLV